MIAIIILSMMLNKTPGKAVQMEFNTKVDEFCKEYQLAYDDLDHPNSILTLEGDRDPITDAEIDLLERVVASEGRGESVDCQEAIATVMLNRWQEGSFGDTLTAVITADGQFADPYDGEISIITHLAVKNALIYYNTYCMCIPHQVLYFRAHHYHTFGKPYCSIDNTYFSTRENVVL